MNLYLMRIRKPTAMPTITGSPPHQSFPFSKVSWKPWVGPGAGTPWRGSVAWVWSVPVSTVDKVHSSLFQERRASRGDWIRDAGDRGSRSKRCRLTGVAPDQGEQEGMSFTSVLTQLPPSFYLGVLLHRKTKGPPIKYQECEVRRTVR